MVMMMGLGKGGFMKRTKTTNINKQTTTKRKS
jgi:hypothetical protein